MPPLEDGLNPATWMLQVSTPGMESTIGVDFGQIYADSTLYECAPHTAGSLISQQSMRTVCTVDLKLTLPKLGGLKMSRCAELSAVCSVI